MSTNEDLFQNQNYLNIETFRKNGQSVRTPVWFVLDETVIYVRTADNSGKIKRIRNSNKVQVAPCKMDGTPLGSWLPAQAMELQDPATNNFVDDLLGKKYGFQKNLFTWISSLRGDRYTVLKIVLSPN
jgi:PPOX class probable F420-dependent enzyme